MPYIHERRTRRQQIVQACNRIDLAVILLAVFVFTQVGWAWALFQLFVYFTGRLVSWWEFSEHNR